MRIRDFRGAGLLVLLWHGAGGDLTYWEAIAPLLAGFHVVAQDLPGHGGSPLERFTIGDGLADADAVVAELGEGPPVVAGHSLGGYLGLRFAATRRCAGWIGLDGPLGLVYPWDWQEAGQLALSRQIGREAAAIDVAGDLAAMKCPAMLLPSAVPANAIEEQIVPGRRALAEHVARRHPEIRVEWLQTGHDAMLFDRPEETAATIRDYLSGLAPS